MLPRGVSVRIRPRHAASLVRLLAQQRQPRLRGAEIGVLKGTLSTALLQQFPNLFLWMVDSWTAASPDSRYYQSRDTTARQSNAQHLSNLQEAFERTSFAADRRVLMRCESVVAASSLPDESLDFVFIDADHTLEAVNSDISSWWPKIRTGGILAGHDYGDRRNRLGFFGVNRAVDEFAARLGLALELNPGSVWSITKPTHESLTPNANPIQAVRVLFGPLATNARLQRSIHGTMGHAWAREQVVHFVAGTENASWLSARGARHVELVTPHELLPVTNRYGSWYMKTYLLDKAMEQYGEVIYLDFDCRLIRAPDASMYSLIRARRPGRCGGSLQAQNVHYRRPVCLTIHRNKALHPVRQCLNASILYCRDRQWLTDWLAAYADVARYGIDPVRFHDETFLMHAIDSKLGVLDPASMAEEFEIPIARLRRNTPEAKARKNSADAYFYHR